MNPPGRFQLTPYRTKLAIDALTGLMIVSIAFALAGLTWRIAGHAGTGAITVPAPPRAAAMPDLAPALALAPFGKIMSTGDGAPPTGLPLQLRGLVFARPTTLAVAYVSANGDTAKPYRIGEAVGGATIDAIEQRRVLLRNNGRIESLGFLDPAAAVGGAPPQQQSVATPPAAPISSPPPPGGSPAGQAAAVDPLSRLDARQVSGGYQIGGNAPPGLQSGDVVQSVNGAQLSSPDTARAAFAKAQSEGNAQIQIIRDGRRLTLTVPIR